MTTRAAQIKNLYDAWNRVEKSFDLPSLPGYQIAYITERGELQLKAEAYINLSKPNDALAFGQWLIEMFGETNEGGGA